MHSKKTPTSLIVPLLISFQTETGIDTTREQRILGHVRAAVRQQQTLLKETVTEATVLVESAAR